jgi:elongation factor G
MKEYATQNIRNIAFVAHSGAGKTSLIEAMLYKAKMISRMGKVEEGNTVMDYEPEEIQRKTSISLSLAYLDWKGMKINIVDTPGYADFQGEVMGALRAADAVVLVVCAASGVEIGTENMWRLAQENSLPVLIVVNKIERENADFQKVLNQLQESFGKGAVAVGAVAERFIDGYRDKLLEAVADVSDALLEKYINEEEIEEKEIEEALVEGVKARQLFPVFAASAFSGEGVEELFDAIVKYLPSPSGRGSIRGMAPGNGEEIEVKLKDEEPVCAFVFKTVADPYVGKLSYVRVFSGLLTTDSTLVNVNKNVQQKVGQLFLLVGKQQQPIGRVHAGDICAIPKLAETSTGDTLCHPSRLVMLPPISYFEPVYQLAIAPKSREDEEKLTMGLNRLTEEDPSFRWWRDNEMKQTIMAGMGDLHLEVTMERLKRKFGVDVELSTPKVPYRETIRRSASAEGKYIRQTGGHGQYGVVYLTVEPVERGRGFEFVNKIVGGAIPRQYIPSVEKGVQKALSEGVLAGYPVVDVRVTLYDGKYHEVDSSDIAFQIAAAISFKNAVLQADPILLEPIMNVIVSVPKMFTGDVIGGLNSKRGRIIGIESESPLIDRIIAQVPLAEMLKYAIDLRSITGGRGSFTISFSHYEEVPPHIAQQIIESSRKEEG